MSKKAEQRKILGWHLEQLAKHLQSNEFNDYEYNGLTALELAMNDYIYSVMAYEYAANQNN